MIKKTWSASVLFVALLVLSSCLKPSTEAETAQNPIRTVGERVRGEDGSRDPFRPNWSHRFNVHPYYSYIGFTARYMGLPTVKGRFKDVNATITYDRGDLFRTSASVFINTGSLETGHPNQEEALKGEAWLAAEQYPQIVFRSKRLVERGDGFDLLGDLTIRDVTKEVTLTIDAYTDVQPMVSGAEHISFTGGVRLNREDFGVVGDEAWNQLLDGAPLVAPEIDIDLRLVATNYTRDFALDAWFVPGADGTPHSSRLLYDVIEAEGLEAALQAYETLKAEHPDRVDENTLGYVSFLLTLDPVLDPEKTEQALALFEYNINQFPDYYIAQRNHAETLAMAGRVEQAREWVNKVNAQEPSLLDAEFFRHYGINF